jgi:hypothetical protein
MWLRLLSIGDCYIVPETLSYIRYHAGQRAKMMKKMKYVQCFEEYRLAKDVQMHKNFNYNIDSNNRGIRKAVRKRATFCVRHAMFKLIPRLYKKETWPIFKKAFLIGWKEHVFGSAVLELFKGLKINVQKLLQKQQLKRA